jgi:hypothetical protein
METLEQYRDLEAGRGYATKGPPAPYQPAGLGWTLPQGAQVRAASLP